MRYRVTKREDGQWAILDQAMAGYCSLLDHMGNLWHLQWSNRYEADAWLLNCYRMWDAGLVPAPHAWRPTTPAGAY